MKVRYYGFMHPCSSYSKTVRSLIELSIEFDVEDAETMNEIKSVDPKVCPTCGDKLILLLILFSITEGVDTS